jgi:RNA polymerase sigma factor (TIGR02999 family)
MSLDPGEEIASILDAANKGQPGATHRLFSLVYDELKKIAKNRISSGNCWSTQTTTLVHEAYLRMIKKDEVSWSSHHHFFWAAARAMRDILVERARHDAASKRGGKLKQIELHDDMVSTPESPDLLDLHEALTRLEKEFPLAAKVVELKHFAGLTREHIGDMMSLSPSAVWREWTFAKAWLSNELDGHSNNLD